MAAARAMTSMVNRVASWRVGQVTLRSSPKTSPKNPKIENRLDGANRTSGLARFCAILDRIPTQCLAAAFSKFLVRAARRAVFLESDSVRRVASVFLCMIRVRSALAGEFDKCSDCVFPCHFNSSLTDVSIQMDW